MMDRIPVAAWALRRKACGKKMIPGKILLPTVDPHKHGVNNYFTNMDGLEVIRVVVIPEDDYYKMKSRS